jgi:formylglycine-generating enzyme required for sulfatase activity
VLVQDKVSAEGVGTRTGTKTRVFISYSRKDIAFADRLEAALTACGFEVLIDREEIYAFEDWWKRLQALIGSSDTVIFVLSPDAVASREVQREVEYAASLNKRFAPIVCRRVDDAAVPEALRRLNFIFFDEVEHFDASTDRLAEALRTDIYWIREHTKFGETARDWAAAGRPNSLLLRPPTLDVAEYWMASRPQGAPEPTREIRTFIAESRKGARTSQRLRRIALGSIFSLMMAVILGLVGWINQQYLISEWHWWTVTRPYAAAQVWPHVLTAAQEQALKPGESFKECATDCPEMVVVPAGSFKMGSTATEFEQPEHTVIIGKAFAVSKYELTFADWDACVTGGGCQGYNPDDEGWGRGRQPVINVDWDDAEAYVAWLSEVTGKTYRLLSEAEYEYATRAGTQTTYPWGDEITLNYTSMANCEGCGSKWGGRGPASQTAQAGSFPPNKFGLYDMVGNVDEWVEDCEHVNYQGAPSDGSAWIAVGNCHDRVLRGGSYQNAPSDIRSSSRGSDPPDDRNLILGFRVGRTLLAR